MLQPANAHSNASNPERCAPVTTKRREARAVREARCIRHLDELRETAPSDFTTMMELLARLVVESQARAAALVAGAGDQKSFGMFVQSVGVSPPEDLEYLRDLNHLGPVERGRYNALIEIRDADLREYRQTLGALRAVYALNHPKLPAKASEMVRYFHNWSASRVRPIDTERARKLVDRATAILVQEAA